MRTRILPEYDKNAITFEMVTSPNTKQPGIKCTVCGKTSYNRNDIEHKYCGNCHQFHPVRDYKANLKAKAA